MLNSMRKPWIVLAFCLPLLFAAGKNRDWKNGQILEPKPPYDPRIHTVEGVEKNYVVRGSFGEAEDTLVAGTPVRYALQGNTMYLSLNGNEYKLTVIGATMKAATPSAPGAATPPAATTLPAGAPPHPAQATPANQTAPPDRTPVAAEGPAQLVAALITLDNDAVVKMIVGGLKEDTVISVIQARPAKFAVGPEALAALKAAGVPQRVIDAMQSKAAAHH